MPEDKKYIVRPGARIRVEVYPGGADTSVTDGAEGEGGGSGIMDSAREEELLRRDAGYIYFYDLGTALLSSGGEHGLDYMRPKDATDKPVPGEGKINEYVERELWENTTPIPTGVELSAADWADFDKELLGNLKDGADKLNPLESTPANGSHRSLSNVMAWSKDFPYDFGLTLYSSPTSRREYSKESKEWKKKPGGSTGENWNSQNIADKTAQDEGVLKVAKRGAKHFIFGGSDGYRGIDTGDTEAYKVTSKPDYAEDRTEFKLNLPLYIYAVPALWFFFAQSAAYAEGSGRWNTDTVLDHTDIITLPGIHGEPVDWPIRYYTWEEGGAGASVLISEGSNYFFTRSPIYPVLSGGADRQAQIQAIFDRNVSRGASKAAKKHYIRTSFVFRRKYTMRVSFLYPLLITSEVVVATSSFTEQFTDVPELETIAALQAECNAEVGAFLGTNANNHIVINPSPFPENPLQFGFYPVVKKGTLAGVVKSGSKVYYVWHNKDS